MSSILDALKKLEEEKQRQLKLLEKEEEQEQEFSEPISISTIAKSDSPLPIQDTASPVISPKFFVVGLIILVITISIISVSASLWVVKTQIAKNTTTTVPAELTNIPQKTTETEITPPPKEELSQKERAVEKKETSPVSVPLENKVENKPPESVVPKPAFEPPPVINPPEKIQQIVPPPPKKESEDPVQVRQPIITEEPPLQVAKNISSEPPNAVVEEVKKEISPPTASPQITEETPQIMEGTPQQSIPEPPPSEVPSPSVNTHISSVPATTESQKEFPPPPPETKPASVPTVVTRNLQPPPALKPEQFQQALTLPKPKAEETVDMTRLPVLRTSDRARLGLEDMKLNVLREAGPKNPHGLAIINLVKVYVGEMIPGTSVRLLDVKTHGIAIEVVGTGERYYVPR